MPLVYDELHRIAALAMRRENAGHTLQTTALVHETYLRIANQREFDCRNHAQFFGVAAQLMRRVLVDHARERLTQKRGGAAQRISLENVLQAPDDEVDVIDLDGALDRLQSIDPAQARLVELRYFAGLSIDETAEALGVSPSTVKREWTTARAWLRRELS